MASAAGEVPEDQVENASTQGKGVDDEVRLSLNWM